MTRTALPRTTKPAGRLAKPNAENSGDTRARTDRAPPFSSGRQFAHAGVTSLKYSTHSPQRNVPQRAQISTADSAG